MNDQEKSIIEWVTLNQMNVNDLTRRCASIEELSDGLLLTELMAEVAPNVFNPEDQNYDECDQWTVKLTNLGRLLEGLQSFYAKQLHIDLNIIAEPIDLTSIAKNNDKQGILCIVELVLGAIVQCDQKEGFIQKLMQLKEQSQSQLMVIIQKIIEKCEKKQTDQDDSNDNKKIIQRLNKRCRDYAVQVEKLQKDLVDQAAKIESLQQDKLQFQQQICNLESKLRQKQKPVRQVQPETSAHSLELEAELQQKDQMLKKLKRQLEENTERYLSQISGLKDELDMCSEKMFKMNQLENSLDMYKKKVEDMNLLRKQVKELTQNNQNLQKELDKWHTSGSSIDQLTTQLEYYKTHYKEEKKKANYYHIELEDREAKLQQTSKSLKESEERKNFLENVTQELKNTIERNRYGHDSLADSDDSFVINRPSALHGELEEVVKRLEKENQMLKNLSGQAQILQEFSEQVDEAYRCKKVAEDALKQVQYEKELHEFEIEKLEAQLKDKTERIEELETNSIILGQSHKSLQYKVDEQTREQERIETLTKENNKLKIERDKNIDDLRKFYKEKDSLTNQLMEYKDLVHELSTQIANLQTFISQLDIEKQRLETRYNQAVENERISQAELLVYKGDNSSTIDQIRVLELERDLIRLQSKLTQCEFEIKEKDEQIYQLEQQKMRSEQDLRHFVAEQQETLKTTHQQQILNLHQELIQKDKEIANLQTSQYQIATEANRELRMMGLVLSEVGQELFKLQNYMHDGIKASQS